MSCWGAECLRHVIAEETAAWTATGDSRGAVPPSASVPSMHGVFDAWHVTEDGGGETGTLPTALNLTPRDGR